MPAQPLNLNLARIVHRLMTTPRGWRVSHLLDELDIAPRTYRKYRQLLQEEFLPFRQRDGTSMLVEVDDGDERYLRLRPSRELVAGSPELAGHAAAVHFARTLMTSTACPFLADAADSLRSEFHATLRGRDFILSGALSEADRMFVAQGVPVGRAVAVADLAWAIANQRHVRLSTADTSMIVAPLSLVLRLEGLILVVWSSGAPIEVDPADFEVEVLPTTFEYPPPRLYEPPV